MADDRPRCEAITPKGTRCQARVLEDSSWCWNHSPETANVRKINARAGGRTRQSQPEPARVREELWRIVEKLLTGGIDRNIATAATMALNTILRSVEVEGRVSEVKALQARLDAIEAEEERSKWAR